MTQRIGIVACSAEGAARCYRMIAMEGAVIMGRHAHPEITLHNYPLSGYRDLFDAGDWDGAALLLLDSARKIADAGADFIICPSNTAHCGFDLVSKRLPLPLIHIADVVVEEAASRGYRKLGIIGTRVLTESAVYPSRLGEIDAEYVMPDPATRDRIDHLIYDELVPGRAGEGERRYFSHVIERFRESGCDAAILGSTVLPSVVSPEGSALPLLDSGRLLAFKALRTAVGHL